MTTTRRNCLQALLATAAGWALAGCGSSGGSGGETPSSPSTRTWRMGFSGLPPRATVAEVIRTIDLWAPRAELAIIHEELPWTELLAGVLPDTIIRRDQLDLVAYYRSKGLQLVFMADLTDGLAREREAPRLRALGRSISEPAVQQAYRAYVEAVLRLLKPEYLGLGAEVNLIRAAAPALYPSVRQAANAAAADVLASGAKTTLFFSVQVETAWGRLGGTVPFVGITTERSDFAFAQMIGLSSYPYLGHAAPEDIPPDYYSRVLATPNPLPAMVVEGGWPSAGASANGQSFVSSPALQARYITRHAALLDSIAAKGVVQIEFADVDVSALTPPLPANLPLFVTLGLVDSQYAAKPALAQWDALFARPR
jgi:hypothetical protein